MFDAKSRYAGLDTATRAVPDRDGRLQPVRYVRRRFLPPPATPAETLAEHLVIQGDRLDNVTARYLDDPEQFWRLADASNAMHPRELTEEVGATITIALPRT